MDARLRDVAVVRDHGSAKRGASLQAALRNQNLKIVEVDLSPSSKEKEQGLFLNKLRQGSHVLCLIIGLTLITNYWSQLQSFVKLFINYSCNAIMSMWYNVKKETGLSHAEDLRLVPDCKYSETDDTDLMASSIKERVQCRS